MRGWTLNELSAQAGISLPFLSDIERGRTDPSLKTLIALAECFEMGAADVLTEAGFSRRYDAIGSRRNLAGKLARAALERALTEIGVDA
jgi:transcriptional regulator with XRE-family HTH domain